MTAKLDMKLDKDGNLSFSFWEWLELQNAEDRERLVEAFGQGVMYARLQDMLVHEYATPRVDAALHDARVAFLTHKDAPEAWRMTISVLLQEARSAEADRRVLWESYWKLYHAWPDEHTRERPHDATYAEAGATPSVTEADIDAAIERIAPESEARP